MKVYRLEGKDNYGVFCSRANIDDTWTDDSIYANQGCSANIDREDESYRFACRSIDRLIEYFGSDFDYMIEQGVAIVEYDVNIKDVVFGNKGTELAFNINNIRNKTTILEGRAWSWHGNGK